MSVPLSIPLSGGASPWIVFGPTLMLAVTGGWLMAKLELRVGTKGADVRPIAEPFPAPARASEAA